MDVKNIKQIVALILCVSATIINAQQTNFKHFVAPINADQSKNSVDSDGSNGNNEQSNLDDATKKNLLAQQKHMMNVLHALRNQEAALSLPKESLNPLAEVIINNYPEEIKTNLLKFVESAGNARLRLKDYKNSLDKEEKISLLNSAKKLTAQATLLSSKLLEVSIGRDELRENIAKLADNLSFKESYNATNEFLSFPERFKFLRLIPPIILHSLSLWESKQKLGNNSFDLHNAAVIARQPIYIEDIRQTVDATIQASTLNQDIRNNENSFSIKDFVWYAALPILAAKHSPEEHAFDLKNPQQLVCFGASIMQYLKPLINLTPRLQELFHIRKSPRDKVIEACAGLVGYSAVFGDLLLNSSMPANKETIKKGYTNDSALPAAQYCPFANKNMSSPNIIKKLMF
ncbi:hypothetical protein EBU24_06605, partial [bacterium]|nr:hypothetical protein [bacterium]